VQPQNCLPGVGPFFEERSFIGLPQRGHEGASPTGSYASGIGSIQSIITETPQFVKCRKGRVREGLRQAMRHLIAHHRDAMAPASPRIATATAVSEDQRDRSIVTTAKAETARLGVHLTPLTAASPPARLQVAHLPKLQKEYPESPASRRRF
jgi:hypothetical protein